MADKNFDKLMDAMVVFGKALKRYNKLMFSMCLEFLTIGTDLTEEPEKKDHWNIRDLVAECDYQYQTYFEPGHNNYELRNEGPEGMKVWRSETAKYRRFIEAYKPYIKNIKCYSVHCSKYDN